MEFEFLMNGKKHCQRIALVDFDLNFEICCVHNDDGYSNDYGKRTLAQNIQFSII